MDIISACYCKSIWNIPMYWFWREIATQTEWTTSWCLRSWCKCSCSCCFGEWSQLCTASKHNINTWKVLESPRIWLRSVFVCTVFAKTFYIKPYLQRDLTTPLRTMWIIFSSLKDHFWMRTSAMETQAHQPQLDRKERLLADFWMWWYYGVLGLVPSIISFVTWHNCCHTAGSGEEQQVSGCLWAFCQLLLLRYHFRK